MERQAGVSLFPNKKLWGSDNTILQQLMTGLWGDKERSWSVLSLSHTHACTDARTHTRVRLQSTSRNIQSVRRGIDTDHMGTIRPGH